MVKITIEHYRHLQEFSPLLCMRCGQEAEEFIPVEFTVTNRSPFLFLLLLAGPLGHIAMSMFPTKTERRRMKIPLCHGHQNHLKKNQFYLIIAAVLILLTMFVFFATFILFLGIRDEFLVAFVILLTICMIAVSWISKQKVRCTYISNQQVDLAGIHPEYASEFNRMQDEFLEAFEKWRIEERQKRIPKARVIRDDKADG